LGSAPLRHALGGWQVSGIISARTGAAVNITQACQGSYHCRVDYVGGDPVLKTPTEIATGCSPGVHCDIQYINTTAFARVPQTPGLGIAVRPGNASKNLVRNPGSWGVELSLAKNFQIQERTRLQFRVDMFNALNHVNWGGVNGSIDSPLFGRITGAGGMRSMQMGLRLQF